MTFVSLLSDTLLCIGFIFLISKFSVVVHSTSSGVFLSIMNLILPMQMQL